MTDQNSSTPEQPQPLIKILKVESLSSQTKSETRFLKQPDIATCVSYALYNATIDAIGNRIPPYTPDDLHASTNIKVEVGPMKGALKDQGVIEVVDFARAKLKPLGLFINGITSEDEFRSGLAKGEKGVIYRRDLSHEVAVVGYKQEEDLVVMFDSLSGRKIKSPLKGLSGHIEWGNQGNYLISSAKKEMAMRSIGELKLK